MGMDVYGRNPKINPNSVCPDEIDWKSSMKVKIPEFTSEQMFGLGDRYMN